MGCDSCAASATVIDAKDLKKLMPKEYGALEQALANADAKGNIPDNFDSFAQMKAGEDTSIDKGVEAAFQALLKAFARKYKGLDLAIGYYDSEYGGRYDDLSDGGFWEVEGVWVPSKAAKKLGMKYLTNARWTVYG
jgi:hypothetical protein